MFKLILVASLFFLGACSGSENPKRLYLQDMSSLSSFEQEQVNEAIKFLNENAGEVFITYSGNRPLIIKKDFLEGTDMGYANPRTYQCIIGLDTDSDLVRAEPRLIQYILIHQLGHCYGLDYSSDPNSVMYPTFDGILDNNNDLLWNENDTSFMKLKNFSKVLKSLSN